VGAVVSTTAYGAASFGIVLFDEAGAVALITGCGDDSDILFNLLGLHYAGISKPEDFDCFGAQKLGGLI
jgi:hypothetical protein